MRTLLRLAFAVLSIATFATTASADLFISEYVEGTSNNKALEIYNPTGAPVDLAAGNYQIAMYFNGSTSPGLTIPLTGIVAPDDVFVIVHASAGPALLALADATNGSGWFNGDDTIVLSKGGSAMVLDVIGQIGFDPGIEWGAGVQSTADNTLRRNATVCDGDTLPSDAFDPSIEWSGFAQDTFDGIGMHTAECQVVPTRSSTWGQVKQIYR